MAIISGNTAMKGVRGRLGEMYYRIRYNIHEVCRMPRMPQKPPTPAQEAQRQLMKDANIYAKRMKTDPEMRAYYEKMAKRKKKTNAWHCALSHYMTTPRLQQVDFSDYRGETDDKIRCQVIGWKSVRSVNVEIKDSGGNVIVSGPARKDDYDWWTYLVPESIPQWKAGTVTFTMTDDLDHVKVREVVIPV